MERTTIAIPPAVRDRLRTQSVRAVASAAFVASIATFLAGCMDETPEYDYLGASFRKLAPEDVDNETKRLAPRIDPVDAERAVPFMVAALREAEAQGHSAIGGEERVQAAHEYLRGISGEEWYPVFEFNDTFYVFQMSAA